MPKPSRDRIAGEHFVWNLFARDGVWYADGRRNTPDLGKHSLGTRDREAALRALNQLDHRKAVELKLAEQRPSSNGHPEVSIADGWERYLAHVARPGVVGGANARTQKRYRAVRDKHVKHCAGRGIVHWAEVDKRMVEQYGTWLSSQEYSDATVYLECTLLKQVINWLIDEERALPESKRVRLKLQRSEVSDTYCYTREQVRAMLQLCRSDPDLGWLADVIVALAATGMRVGELAALRWSDVDLDAGVITVADNRHSGRARKAGAVRTTKGRRSRRVHIHPKLREVLLRLPHRGGGGRVFRGRRGGPLDPDKVLTSLKRDVIASLKERFPTPKGEIGFEHGRVHSFRHYFVTEAFLGGATDGEVRDWVGHRDSRIVERYRHLRGSAAQQTMARLDFLGNDGQFVTTSFGPGSGGPTRAGGFGEANDKHLNSNRVPDGPNGSAPR